MRPPLAAAVVVAFLAAAVFGFGHATGAWDAPAVAEPGTPAKPPVRAKAEAPKQTKQARRERQAKERRSRPRPALPTGVVAELDELCRRAHADAERLAAARPATKNALLRLFDRLGRLSEAYNVEALALLAPHADDPRTRRLTRLFAREKRLFARLLAAVPGVDSPTGRVRFENRLAELRLVGLAESRVLAALGARECGVTPAL